MALTTADILNIVANRPDAYAGAETQLAAERMALMQAMASAGSAGKAAYEQAKNNAAVNQALAMQQVQNIGDAPAGLLNALANRVAQAGAEQAGYLNANQGNWSNYYDAMTQSNDAYLGRLASTVPMLRQQAADTLTSNLTGLQTELEGKLAEIKQQAALQLANMQMQDWLRTEGYKREDKLREEDWQHQVEFLKLQQALGGGGGGGGGGSRYGSSGWTPARWQHDPTTGDPFGNLGPDTGAPIFANAAYASLSGSTPLATFRDSAQATANREMRFTADGRPYWTNSSNPVEALTIANRSRAQGILNNADYALNGGAMYGITEQLLNDANYNDLAARANPDFNDTDTYGATPRRATQTTVYGPPAPTSRTSTARNSGRGGWAGGIRSISSAVRNTRNNTADRRNR